MCRTTYDSYDTHPLRNLVAERLALNRVPDVFWKKRVTRQLVGLWDDASSAADKLEVQAHLVNSRREDVAAFKDLGGDATAWTTPHRKGDTSVRADLSPDDPIALRADALCVYWAKLAEADSEVRSFRRKVLEGKAVSANEAGELLSSPATSLISQEAFARNDVPIVGHTAKFIVQKRSNQFERPYTT